MICLNLNGCNKRTISLIVPFCPLVTIISEAAIMRLFMKFCKLKYSFIRLESPLLYLTTPLTHLSHCKLQIYFISFYYACNVLESQQLLYFIQWSFHAIHMKNILINELIISIMIRSVIPFAGGSCRVETSQLIWSENHLIGFNMLQVPPGKCFRMGYCLFEFIWTIIRGIQWYQNLSRVLL